VSLLDDDTAETSAYRHAAFWLASDDLAGCVDQPLDLAHASTVAGALGVMARLDPEKLDPMAHVDDQREDRARAMVAACARYKPLVVAKVPALAPYFAAFAEAGPAIEAALDGDDPRPLDPALLERLPGAVFRVPAIRAYLTGYFDRMLPGLEDGYSMGAALGLCLRFRRWYTPTAFHRRTLRDYVKQPHSDALARRMKAAWKKLKEPA
jgi:hypothetical protein